LQTKKMVILSLFLGAGITLYFLEASYIPSLPIPGAKLGLANIITLILIMFYGWRESILNVVARTIIGSMITGTFLTPAFIFSFAGALISTLIMILVYARFFGKFSLVGISICGAVSHNLVQMVLAGLLLSHWGILMELPFLILIAVFTGTFNGVGANYLIRKILSLPKQVLEISVGDDKVLV